MDNSHVGLWLVILLIIVQTIYLASTCNKYFFLQSQQIIFPGKYEILHLIKVQHVPILTRT